MKNKVGRRGFAFVYFLVAALVGAGACSTAKREFPGQGGGGDAGERQSGGAAGSAGRGGGKAAGSSGRLDDSNQAGDANSSAGTDGDTGGVGGSSTAGAGAGGGTGSPDGVSCSADSECANRHCIDGVCCESACEGCNACANALTSQKDGKCAPVVNGQDPHSACADETATNQCGKDGECDGNGACRKVSPSHVCTQGACSADGKTFTPPTTCNSNGSGACSVAAAQDCGGYPCTASGCAKPCATQSDCGTSGNYCNQTTGKCAAQKPDGSTATNAYECTSGIVADGVCCNQACTGCKACTSALNGQGANTTGQCLPVKAAMTAPHNACTANPPCGLDGTCDGNGSCRYPNVGSSCGTASCSGSTLTAKVCDGAHACSSATGSACPNALVCASASACKSTCAADTDCTSGYYCAAGTCTLKKASGACTSGSQCGNGFCVDGYCCDTQCTGNCQSCKQTPGTCKSVTTPRTACSGSGTCGTQKCDGTHADCVYPISDVACPNTCAADLSGVMASVCNGSGACGTAVKNACNSDQFCNTASASCTAKLASGTSSSCTKDIQCQSGSCCGGHCVNKSNDKANCGACGNACGSSQICSNGACVCNAGLCGGSDLCGTWAFDSCILDSATWTLDDLSTNQSGAYALAVSSVNAVSAPCGLKFNMTSSGNYAFLHLHLCNGNGKTTVVKGVQFHMRLEGTALNGVVSKGGIVLENNGTEVGGANWLPFPFTTGVDQLISVTFSASGPATDIDFNFLAPGYTWDGTAYIDDVKIF